MSHSPEIQRLDDAQFEPRPHRPSLRFRDLGIAARTDGAIGAQVVRATAASNDPQVPHRHDATTQFFYVLSGELEVEYESGLHTLVAGDVVFQPGGAVHRIVRHSADLELLEVSIPASYSTEVAP